MATQIFLIRHGETQSNLEDRYSGITDVALTEEGLRQAELTAAFFRDIPLAALYSSPLSRARDTASPLAALWGLKVEIREELIEINYGKWEECTVEQIRAGWEPQWRRFLSNPADFSAPGGETGKAVESRIRRCLLELIRVHDNEAIALVSHKSPIRILLAGPLGLELRNFREKIPLDNAAISLMEVDGPSTTVAWYNSTIHLTT